MRHKPDTSQMIHSDAKENYVSWFWIWDKKDTIFKIHFIIVLLCRAFYQDWQTKYEHLADMVVPRSSRLIFEDHDHGLYTVTLFSKVVDEYKLHARENKCVKSLCFASDLFHPTSAVMRKCRLRWFGQKGSMNEGGKSMVRDGKIDRVARSRRMWDTWSLVSAVFCFSCILVFLWMDIYLLCWCIYRF